MKKTLSEKIVLLNQTTLDSMMEKDNLAIIKNFTEVCINILEADFGFAWWKFHDNEEYRLAYKSSTTPYEPTIPRESAGNYIARKTKKPFFDSQVKKKNYIYDISKYLKSYIIIPIYYSEFIYGSLVLCYKKEHFFTKGETELATVLGTTTAQSINIQRLMANEKKTLVLAQKQKETETLLAQEKSKTEFIANAAHELRTPLAIIKGNIDLAMLRVGKTPKTSENYLKAIDCEIKHLSSILSDLSLITSKDKELKNKIFYEKVNVDSLIKVVIERSKALAYKKNISIKSRLIPNFVIFGDKVYLEKMLLNLVKNSIIYGNKNGHTKITTKKLKGFLTINIADDGIGISKEDLPHIFERFYRADKSHSSDGNSTGLGLSIVKWVVEAHGGTVSVINNKHKKGTVFCVSLPIKTISN